MRLDFDQYYTSAFDILEILNNLNGFAKTINIYMKYMTQYTVYEDYS